MAEPTSPGPSGAVPPGTPVGTTGAQGLASDTTGQSESLTGAGWDPSSETFGASQLSPALQRLREALVAGLPDASTSEHRGELTLHVDADRLLDVLRFCRDDQAVRCELLSDISAVHWPGGIIQESDQETTGWPTYTHVQEQGRFDLNYVLRSVSRHHWFRLQVQVSDEPGTSVASATPLYSSANFMERELFDMAGVIFDGHPSLTRVHMPEDWDGHPHRKDYPLGGVEVMYKGVTIPPPDERDY